MLKILKKVPKIILALLIQFGVLLVVAVGVYGSQFFIEPPYPYWILVLIQASLAAVVSCKLGLPCWWRWIQFLIPTGLYVGVLVGFDPVWALALFILVWLVFSNSLKERVPLYLTNNTTREALKSLVKRKRNIRFLDLGCGLGGNVAFMSQQKAVAESHGVETAPVPYIVSTLMTSLRGGNTYAMDIWNTELAYYDLVYAFLSPEPMQKLWAKVQDEMHPGSVFVSNSFAVPDVEASEVWALDDKRKTILYIYHL